MFGTAIDAEVLLFVGGREGPRDSIRSTALCARARGCLPSSIFAAVRSFDAAGISGVPVMNLVGALVAGEHDLAGINDDDIVAAIHVVGKGRLVLAL